MATKMKITEDSGIMGTRRTHLPSARLFLGRRRRRISPLSSPSVLFHASAAKWRTLDLLQVVKKAKCVSCSLAACSLSHPSSTPLLQEGRQ